MRSCGNQVTKEDGAQSNAEKAGKDHIANLLKEVLLGEGKDIVQNLENIFEQICKLRIVREEPDNDNGGNDRSRKSYKTPAKCGEETALFALFGRQKNNDVLVQRGKRRGDKRACHAAQRILRKTCKKVFFAARMRKNEQNQRQNKG